MNRRERNLLVLVGSLVGVFLLGFGGRYLFLQPLRERDKQIGAMRLELGKLASERRAYFDNEDKLKALTGRTFSDDVDQASAKSGEVLTKLILQSGLPESSFVRLPVGPRKLRGASEVGWSIQGEGPLMQVVNLLFLLRESPYLHRLENITVAPAEIGGKVRVRMLFLTLVMVPAPPVEWRELPPQFTLDSAERRGLDSIVSRDILRPYIKRPPALPVGAGGKPVSVAKVQTTPESLRVVSLSEWGGAPEVHVRDQVNQRTLRYRPGDSLGGGVVVTVDYRPLPMPGNEALKSFSRVILKMGDEYWAVEHGRTLAEKYKLAPDQVPEKGFGQ